MWALLITSNQESEMKGKEEKKFTTVSIPTPLLEKVEERIRGTGFTSVSGN